MSQPLVITKPSPMTDLKLVATNVTEADYPEYNPSVTYAKGDRCITSATHDVWQSADDGNIGNNPLTSVGKWASPGKTNRWRAFDDAINTQTLNPTLIHYQIRPFSSVTNVSFLNVSNALTIRVQMIDPSVGTVYDKTLQMTKPPEVSSWWVWSFGGRRVAAFASFDDLPAYPDADLHINIEGGASLGVGVIMFGQSRSFGMGAQYGARVGMLSHSVRERDDFGALRLKRRLPSKRMNFSFMLSNKEVDALNGYLMEIDAVPCFFSASSEFESMNIYGIIGNFDTVISYPDHSICDIEIEGLQ